MPEERNPLIEAVITDGVLTHLLTERNDHQFVKLAVGGPLPVAPNGGGRQTAGFASSVFAGAFSPKNLAHWVLTVPDANPALAYTCPPNTKALATPRFCTAQNATGANRVTGQYLVPAGEVLDPVIHRLSATTVNNNASSTLPGSFLLYPGDKLYVGAAAGGVLFDGAMMEFDESFDALDRVWFLNLPAVETLLYEVPDGCWLPYVFTAPGMHPSGYNPTVSTITVASRVELPNDVDLPLQASQSISAQASLGAVISSFLIGPLPGGSKIFITPSAPGLNVIGLFNPILLET